MTSQSEKESAKDGKASTAPRQNSYKSPTPDAPDIQQPGPPGDFGTGSTNTPADVPKSTALPSKHSAGRTPGDQPHLAHQPEDGTTERPDDAAEPSNPYSGT